MGEARAQKPDTGPRFIRAQHPYAFRSGEWARILTTAPDPVHTDPDRSCYVVEFPDGATDWWVVDDPVAEYEFSQTVLPDG